MKNRIQKLIVCLYFIAPALCFGAASLTNVVVGSSPDNSDGDMPRQAYQRINANENNMAGGAIPLTGSNVILLGQSNILISQVFPGSGTISATLFHHDWTNSAGFPGVLPGDSITVVSNAQGTLVALNEQWNVTKNYGNGHLASFEEAGHNYVGSNVYFIVQPGPLHTMDTGTNFYGGLQGDAGLMIVGSSTANSGALRFVDASTLSNNWQVLLANSVGDFNLVNWGLLGGGTPLFISHLAPNNAFKVYSGGYVQASSGFAAGNSASFPITFAGTGLENTNQGFIAYSNDQAGHVEWYFGHFGANQATIMDGKIP